MRQTYVGILLALYLGLVNIAVCTASIHGNVVERGHAFGHLTVEGRVVDGAGVAASGDFWVFGHSQQGAVTSCERLRVGSDGSFEGRLKVQAQLSGELSLCIVSAGGTDTWASEKVDWTSASHHDVGTVPLTSFVASKESVSDAALEVEYQKARLFWVHTESGAWICECLSEMVRRAGAWVPWLGEEFERVRSGERLGWRGREIPDLIVLTALRRAQRKPDPVDFGVASVMRDSGAPSLELWVRNVDVERQPFTIEELVFNRDTRDVRVSIEIVDSQGITPKGIAPGGSGRVVANRILRSGEVAMLEVELSSFIDTDGVGKARLIVRFNALGAAQPMTAFGRWLGLHAETQVEWN